MVAAQKVAVLLLLASVVDGFRVKPKRAQHQSTLATQAMEEVQEHVTQEPEVDPDEDQGSNDALRNEMQRELNESVPITHLNLDSMPHCHLSESDCNIGDMSGPTVVFTNDNSKCLNGDAYAFLVKPGRSDKLLYYFTSGGACWESPIFVDGLSLCTDSLQGGMDAVGLGSGITDPRAENDLADFTLVSLPYCDGGAFVTNTTLGDKPQHGYQHALSAAEWAKKNLDSTLSSFVMGGSSAGALGTLAWSNWMLSYFQYDKATVLVDSYLGVFPTGTIGPTIKNFGACNLPIVANFRDFGPACEAERFDIVDFWDYAMEQHPTVAFAVIQPKWDIVQRLFYAAVALSYLNLDLYMSTVSFYETTNNMLRRYSRHHNFVNYYVDGGFHTFLQMDFYYSATVTGFTGLLGSGGKPSLSDWTKALVDHEPVQSQCNGDLEVNGGDNWVLRNTRYCDQAVHPRTLSIYPATIAARRMEGFSRIWDIAGAAAWHAANTLAGFGYGGDAEEDLQRRDAAAAQLSFDWQRSTLQPIADNVKWMAQDFAWYANNNLWNDATQENSHDYANYVQHREQVKAALKGAGAPADELFSRINQMIVEYAWMAAQTRYWWNWPYSNDEAEGHRAVVADQLNNLLAGSSWPLFDQ